jgi:hypothetical protein
LDGVRRGGHNAASLSVFSSSAAEGGTAVVYPLEVGGRDDYPVKVGSMLMTMVDPHPGFERAYNRWYERDHYYEGCMIGPWMYAGSRWVAPRSLKNLRWPAGDETVARPYDAGSYISIYWVQEGHHEEHFGEWAGPQVRKIYATGRGFAERRHIHTIVMDKVGVVYRDDDGVPLDVALDSRYDGIVVLWFDGEGGRTAQDLHAELSKQLMPDLLKDTQIESISSWTPSNPDAVAPSNAPMDLGTPGGGRNRLAQILFVRGPVQNVLGKVHAYTDAIDASGIAKTHLAAPFFATTPGIDTYVEELW